MLRIFIVEDETPAYIRLRKLIKEIQPDALIEEQIPSIKEFSQKLSAVDTPDVAFLDIHLSDGTILELLETHTFTFPVIFTTAYSEYTLAAFKTLSVDYILKPVKKADLEQSFQKLSRFERLFEKKAAPLTSPPGQYKKRFIVRYGEHIKTINTEEIAYFSSKNKNTIATTFEGRSYPIDYNLETLTDIVNPEYFFRINRQLLISIDAIAEMRSYSKARVIIKLRPDCSERSIVSSERAAAFKKWLGGEV